MGAQFKRIEDRRIGAFEPGFRISQSQDDLGFRIMLQDFRKKRDRGPLDRGIVRRENLVPIDRFPIHGILPNLGLIGLPGHFEQVVAGTIPEFLKGTSQAVRSGPTKSGTNNL
jgi:hypothetical protein